MSILPGYEQELYFLTILLRLPGDLNPGRTDFTLRLIKIKPVLFLFARASLS
jgi:hypothetical protein